MLPNWFMNFYGAYGRVSFFLILFAPAALVINLPRWTKQVLPVFIILVVMVQIGYLVAYEYPVSRVLKSEVDKASALVIPENQFKLDDVDRSYFQDPLMPKEVMQWNRVRGLIAVFPTIRLHHLVAARDKLYIPTFQTSLLIDRYQEPLGHWVEGRYVPPDWAGKQIFIYGETSNRKHLESQISPEYHETFDSVLFTVMERDSVQAPPDNRPTPR